MNALYFAGSRSATAPASPSAHTWYSVQPRPTNGGGVAVSAALAAGAAPSVVARSHAAMHRRPALPFISPAPNRPLRPNGFRCYILMAQLANAAHGYGSTMAWAQSIGLTLRRDDPVPVGLQLEWGLRGAILAGHLAAGERLPGLRELADDVGVNVNTVRSVYARLEGDGLVETRHGAGSFVCPRPAAVQLGWAEARARAEQAARRAGMTPQQLAAALYMSEPEA